MQVTENWRNSSVESVHATHSVVYKDRYIVYNCGCIYDTQAQRMLSRYRQSSGYVQVQIHRKKEYLHRIVMIAFEGLQEGKEVNHNDGNKNNCMLYNLSWMTKAQNIKHSFDTGLNQTPMERIMNMVAARRAKINPL